MKYLPFIPAIIIFLIGAVVATEWVDRTITNALYGLTKWPRVTCQRITIFLMLAMALSLALVVLDLLTSPYRSRT